ncbi:hypothetical protein LCGC14_1512110 [marine sediment metagenome]|uniref:Fibronectin type-III domain-containing protein n=1 Tax=marine sediment metagenome TaxID=412755 RepID=A0A0F9J1D8_9ZZZZ
MPYQLLRPNAEGDLQQINRASPDVDHWLNLDEVVADDNTTGIWRFGSGPSWQSDLYHIPSYTESYDLDEIIVHARVKTAGWYPKFNKPYILIKTGGTVYEYQKDMGGDYAWRNEYEKLTTNPFTGLPWTIADIASLQIGIKLSSDYGFRQDCTGSCTQLYVAVGTPGVPVLSTQAVTDISIPTATGNGNIISFDDPGGVIALANQHGHCWNTTGAPTIADDKTENGATAATGPFTSAMAGLVAGVRYYVRPYATNPVGTGYGDEVEFVAPVSPTVSADPATDVAANSSTLNGTLDADGGEACDCGFEWGETVAYGNTTSTQSKVTGETFSQAISGLTPGTLYHFRAFSTNVSGTSYGDDRTFTTAQAISRGYALSRHEL